MSPFLEPVLNSSIPDSITILTSETLNSKMRNWCLALQTVV
jgi:hypothetical protein